jgi:hypothetical protein
MSEKSVSQIANECREKDHEASRKPVSPNKGKTEKERVISSLKLTA